MVSRLLKPWLLLPPWLSHSIGPQLLRLWAFLKFYPKQTSPPLKLLGINFKNRVGTAGGLDKEAKDLETWTKFGAGFLEIGTFTPRPQGPNPGKILDRDVKHQAIWNCMGFPNAGFEAVLPKIKKYKKSNKSVPLFINIGKNRDTPLDQANKDYILGIEFFKDVADAYVLNISSPNTKDLRLLHKKENFLKFINPILDSAKKLERKIPVLVKLSPDLDDEALSEFIKDAQELSLDGFIISNTTVSRPEGVSFPQRGGLSGKPLGELSFQKLVVARKSLDTESSKILISVGGICSPDEALKRIEAGADLVQVYSGLIFYGPSLIKDSARKLESFAN